MIARQLLPIRGFSTANKGTKNLLAHYVSQRMYDTVQPQRRNMERIIIELQHEIKYNHLPSYRRIPHFLWRKKWRFVCIGLATWSFTYWANGVGFASSKLERTFKRYKRSLLTKYVPTCMAYQTALENTWEPKKLSRVSTEKLSDVFVKLDRELKHGVSRRLILDVLVKMQAVDSETESKTFL
jgi:hypothetical protein